MFNLYNDEQTEEGSLVIFPKWITKKEECFEALRQGNFKVVNPSTMGAYMLDTIWHTGKL